MDDLPDLEKRDPNSLNENCNVVFEDAIGETDSLHSIDCVWTNSYKCFTCGKSCCYKLMTTLCGICIGLYWGCEFAIITFQTVWCITPAFKMATICCGHIRRCIKLVLDACLAPLCETIGLLFSQVQVTHVK